MAESTGKPAPIITLREITEETFYPICKLSNMLSEAQQRMVAPNAVSMAHAHFNSKLWMRAIYADEEPAGFMMLYEDPEKPEYFLWRLMVAGPFQGLDIGARAMQLLIEHVKTRPGAKELLVSCEEGEGSPEGFYLKQGFCRNGRMYGDEIGLVLPFLS